MVKYGIIGVLLVSQSLFGISGAHAASDKTGVSHIEGAGLVHLINISDKAVPAHRRHGVALPGGGVPGDPWALVKVSSDPGPVSSCPCDFSAAGLAEVTIDGDGPEICTEAGGEIKIVGTEGEGGIVRSEKLGGSFRCVRLGPGVEEFRNPSTRVQFDDCNNDLRQAAACQP